MKAWWPLLRVLLVPVHAAWAAASEAALKSHLQTLLPCTEPAKPYSRTRGMWFVVLCFFPILIFVLQILERRREKKGETIWLSDTECAHAMMDRYKQWVREAMGFPPESGPPRPPPEIDFSRGMPEEWGRSGPYVGFYHKHHKWWNVPNFELTFAEDGSGGVAGQGTDPIGSGGTYELRGETTREGIVMTKRFVRGWKTCSKAEQLAQQVNYTLRTCTLPVDTEGRTAVGYFGFFEGGKHGDAADLWYMLRRDDLLDQRPHNLIAANFVEQSTKTKPIALFHLLAIAAVGLSAGLLLNNPASVDCEFGTGPTQGIWAALVALLCVVVFHVVFLSSQGAPEITEICRTWHHHRHDSHTFAGVCMIVLTVAGCMVILMQGVADMAQADFLSDASAGGHCMSFEDIRAGSALELNTTAGGCGTGTCMLYQVIMKYNATDVRQRPYECVCFWARPYLYKDSPVGKARRRRLTHKKTETKAEFSGCEVENMVYVGDGLQYNTLSGKTCEATARDTLVPGILNSAYMLLGLFWVYMLRVLYLYVTEEIRKHRYRAALPLHFIACLESRSRSVRLRVDAGVSSKERAKAAAVRDVQAPGAASAEEPAPL